MTDKCFLCGYSNWNFERYEEFSYLIHKTMNLLICHKCSHTFTERATRFIKLLRSIKLLEEAEKTEFELLLNNRWLIKDDINPSKTDRTKEIGEK